MKAYERLEQFIKTEKINCEVVDVDAPDLSIEAHVKALGIRYMDGMGALLMKDKKGMYYCILRRDDRNLDLKKLKELLEVKKLSMVRPEELETLGFEPGLMAPILLRNELGDKVKFIFDQKLTEIDNVVCGVGHEKKAMKIDLKEFIKVIGDYKILEFTVPNPDRQDAGVDVTKSDIRSDKIKRVLSGITPSGDYLHIGNYFGAVKPQMDLQGKIEKTFYFVADLHALTTIQDKKQLETNIINNILDFIALGLDPKQSVYFRQSDVPAHSQLMVVLGNYIPLGLMKRMHAFKDKLAKGGDESSINMGLFNYPILMAADILLYHPDGVPVGEDQRQHIELTRDVAAFYNRAYETKYFKRPEPLIQTGMTGKVIGTDGERKMSKSLGNVIGIFEDEEVIKKQIMSCYTDPNRIKATDPGTVEGNPVFIFHDLINEDKEQVADLKKRYRAGTVGDVEVKEKLFEAHKKRFAEAREKRAELSGNIQLAKDILADGARQANEVANETMAEVYEMIGIKNDLSV
jgi:tryptophanyl-tRNA synthetase